MDELWEPPESPVQRCSILHYLNLVGINTPYVESLTSHISRLAEAHSLYPGVLMERGIAPLIAKQYTGGNLHTIYSHTCALNGTGVMASDLVQALNNLTGHRQLHLLTMLPWVEVVPQRELLYSSRFWCPQCYEENRISGFEIHEPLLWTLKIVKICPIHQQLLFNLCPHCGQTNYLLSWRSRVGYCSKCQKWLGASRSGSLYEYNSVPEVEMQRLVWSANAVGELIASAPSLPTLIARENVARGLGNCVEFFADGNIAEFARLVQAPKNTVWLWCKGKNLPQLDTLVALCFRLKISVLDLLMNEKIETLESVIRLSPGKPISTRRSPDTRLADLDRVESHLAAVLLDHKLPPPSLEAASKALGFHRETLYRNFKELCRAISARYDQYEQIRYLRSIEECCEEVRQVVHRLHREGTYPSEARVSQHLTKPGYLRNKRVRSVLQETRQGLGLTK
ncbi:TniQ family protein [Leptolyngbya ohadii]|uniref:TniQ family protein n=1 Tax=Leptolyngbya ohadii TaxID=1962290 RepID=UPI000B5A0755|nr:TniQ family protein [Leptolyngbya ohadii]